jgi:hypothetical protein
MKSKAAQKGRKRGKSKDEPLSKKLSPEAETGPSYAKHRETQEDQRENKEKISYQDIQTHDDRDEHIFDDEFDSDEQIFDDEFDSDSGLELEEIESFTHLYDCNGWRHPGESRQDLIRATINLVKCYDTDRVQEGFVNAWLSDFSQFSGCLVKEDAWEANTTKYRAGDKVPRWARILASAEDLGIDPLSVPHGLQECPLVVAAECDTCAAENKEMDRIRANIVHYRDVLRKEKAQRVQVWKNGLSTQHRPPPDSWSWTNDDRRRIFSMVEPHLQYQFPKAVKEERKKKEEDSSRRQLAFDNNSSSNNTSSNSSSSSRSRNSIHNNTMPNTQVNSSSKDSSSSSSDTELTNNNNNQPMRPTGSSPPLTISSTKKSSVVRSQEPIVAPNIQPTSNTNSSNSQHMRPTGSPPPRTISSTRKPPVV